MKDKIIWSLVCMAVGFVVCLFVIPKSPDVNTATENSLRKTITDMVKSKKINSKTNVKGAKQIDVKPDGSMSFFGNNLDFYNDYEEINQLHLRINDLEKELKTTKTINYSGSVFVLWDKLEYVPCTVGITYLVISPIHLIGQYDLPQNKIKVGLMLQF